MTFKKVTVMWYDAHSNDGWKSLDNALGIASEMLLCETTGYQLLKTKELIVVSHTVAIEKDGTVSVLGHLHIPIRCVKSIKYIKE